MVPTNTIRKQTAVGLKKPVHPLRAAIDDAFAGRVAVFDMGSTTDDFRDPLEISRRLRQKGCSARK